MHGRLKVKTTAEQQEAKRKEREKKLHFYQLATSKVFQKRLAGELDQEMLNLTADILASNPDFSTFWNIRREVFISWKILKSVDELPTVFSKELHFLEDCLRVNPKSYGTWHQRRWVMDNMADPNWKHELVLCSRFLEYDERNFHCWDYRRFVVARSSVSAESELEFTTDKIGANFSNFSSWHYRSKLLAVVYPDPSQPTGVQEKACLDEFDLVQNAFFTDPNDQSAWFYHRWLLGRGEEKLRVRTVHCSETTKQILVILTRPATYGKEFSLSVNCDDDKLDVSWSTPLNNTSVLWVGSGASLDEKGAMKVSITGNNITPSVHNIQQDTHWKLDATLFSRNLSAATSTILTQELESCKQLHDMEPDNKWVVLTMVSLMQALDPVQYKVDTVLYCDKLVDIDPMRTRYYNDLKSRFIMEISLLELPANSCTFQLSNANLTAAYHLEYLVTMTTIDLSHNALVNVKLGHMLQCVTRLNLSHNKLVTCDGIQRLPALQTLDISNNDIKSYDDLSSLTTCSRLDTLLLDGNPITQLPDYQHTLRQRIASLRSIH